MKFEENMKEKLAGRTIAPSGEAWQRIAKKLDENPKRTKSKTGYWFAIAAGFIGILILAGSLFFSPGTENIYPVVDTTNEKKAAPESIPQDKKLLKTPENRSKITENQAEKTPDLPQNRSKNGQNSVKPEQKMEIPLSAKEPVVAVEDSAVNSRDFDPSLQKTIDQEVEHLLARVDSIGKNETEVSDAQVDALLAQAQEKILKNRVFEAETQALSATALLQEVEGELDRSFRERIFEALKDGFNKAREAVASRND